MRASQALQPSLQHAADTVDVAQDVVFQNVGDDGKADRAHERVTTERGSMIAWLEDSGRLFGQDRPDWHAATEALGQGHDVRLDTPALEAPQRAESADARLDLVQHEEQILVAAEIAHIVQ